MLIYGAALITRTKRKTVTLKYDRKFKLFLSDMDVFAIVGVLVLIPWYVLPDQTSPLTAIVDIGLVETLKDSINTCLNHVRQDKCIHRLVDKYKTI